MSVKEEFAIRLKKIRKNEKLTQAQFAEKLGVTRGSISAYETGKKTPDIEFLDKVSLCFNFSLNYFFGRSDYDFFTKDEETRVFWKNITDYKEENFIGVINSLFAIENLIDDDNWILWEGIRYIVGLFDDIGSEVWAYIDAIESGRKPDMEVFEDIHVLSKAVSYCIHNKTDEMISNLFCATYRYLKKLFNEEDTRDMLNLTELYLEHKESDEVREKLNEYWEILNRLWHTNNLPEEPKNGGFEIVKKE